MGPDRRRRRSDRRSPTAASTIGRLNQRTWLFAEPGRLRSPWRILIFLLATFACGFVASLFVGSAISFLYSLTGIRVSSEGWVIVAALLGGHLIALRYIDHRPWSDVWLDRAAARPALLARGFLFGALAIGIPTLFLIAIGSNDWDKLVAIGLACTAGALLVEELGLNLRLGGRRR